MKKLTYEGWVSSFIEKLAEYFDLVGWEITVEFSKKVAEEENGNIYAKVIIDPTYQMASIICYPAAKQDFQKKDYTRLVARLTHELVHTFFSPFEELLKPFLSDTTRPFFSHTLENQTQKLTAVFLKTLPESLVPPR